MSQGELGNKLKITFQQIQKYEKGTNRIGASRLFELSTALKVPVSYFFEGLYGNQSNTNMTVPGFADENQNMQLNRLVEAFNNINDPETFDATVALVERIAAIKNRPAPRPSSRARKRRNLNYD